MVDAPLKTAVTIDIRGRGGDACALDVLDGAVVINGLATLFPALPCKLEFIQNREHLPNIIFRAAFASACYAKFGEPT